MKAEQILKQITLERKKERLKKINRAKFSRNKSLLSYYGFTEIEQRKYPVVVDILKQLTPERKKEEIEEINKIKLPLELQKWIKEYEKIGYRNEFLWRWLYKAFKITHLPFISDSIKSRLLNIKVLLTMFITLLDDVADRDRNQLLLKSLLEIPFQKEKFINFDNLSLNSEEKKYFELSLELWNYILNSIQKNLVNYKKYKEIFEFDLLQVLNEMRFAYLLNKYPCLTNKNEYWTFLSYNMSIFVYSDLDLMSCSKFNIRKFGILREVIWDIQRTTRIGNWLSTWQRELKENDFSNIIFVYYLENKEYNFLNKINKKKYLKVIKEIEKQKIEKKLLKEWEKYYFNIKLKDKANKDFKIDKLLETSKNILFLHLVSKDYI